MANRKEICTRDGDVWEVEISVPRNYKFDNEDRNQFLENWSGETASDREIEDAISKGWARKIRKTGEW